MHLHLNFALQIGPQHVLYWTFVHDIICEFLYENKKFRRATTRGTKLALESVILVSCFVLVSNNQIQSHGRDVGLTAYRYLIKRSARPISRSSVVST